MCVEIKKNETKMNAVSNKKKVSYSIKKLLKQIVKHYHKSQKLAHLESVKKAESLESVESLDNNNNANIEIDCKSSMESLQNNQNERISFENEQACVELSGAYEFSEISIGVLPVHFITTDHGSFFWTATTDVPADNDLEEALNWKSGNQLATCQSQDRWAQA
ncbi:enhancer of split m4 protein-like [Musca autumnalis]|uniref:enhancer of split m4 protein-like n=1 Tax=Musca autumnalis TaxID=221902 RepID=UPI003CF7D8CD